MIGSFVITLKAERLLISFTWTCPELCSSKQNASVWRSALFFFSISCNFEVLITIKWGFVPAHYISIINISFEFYLFMMRSRRFPWKNMLLLCRYVWFYIVQRQVKIHYSRAAIMCMITYLDYISQHVMLNGIWGATAICTHKTMLSS